jgi:hypothetical protein
MRKALTILKNDSPLIVLTITIVWLLKSIIVDFVYVTKEHYFGFGAFLLILFFYIIKRHTISYWLLLLTLIFGTLTRVCFTPFQAFFSFGRFQIDVYCFLLLITTIIVKRDLIAKGVVWYLNEK